MVAATGYILLALSADAPHTNYGRIILVALGFCWLGDVMLLAKGRGKYFLGGLGSFLLGHVAYALAFYVQGPDLGWSLAGGAAAAVLGLVVFRWIMRHDVPDGMTIPVGAYVVAISVMMALAIGTYGHSGRWILPLGAAAFIVSDIFVARERFVVSSRINVGVGLPLYFIGQVLLALTV